MKYFIATFIGVLQRHDIDIIFITYGLKIA